jgi:hypothetical protein
MKPMITFFSKEFLSLESEKQRWIMLQFVIQENTLTEAAVRAHHDGVEIGKYICDTLDAHFRGNKRDYTMKDEYLVLAGEARRWVEARDAAADAELHHDLELAKAHRETALKIESDFAEHGTPVEEFVRIWKEKFKSLP